MAKFIELTESQNAQRFLVNLEEVTFIQSVEKKEGKRAILHFTSSTYAADRTVEVMEDYNQLKNFVMKAEVLMEE
jgi:hypothetical protein